ncbi:MAG: efflux RND transporter permease subunit [Planktomarina sp.]|nr:efflux RND transporter permease subunit [Planktomarina sp.]MDT2057845.1 efflux RND transporter permease subunit [Planktomarina sp.]
MIGLVDWAIARARMVLAFILLSLAIGTFAYAVLPKEGEPDIEIPAIIISMPFQGISAEDSEKLLIKPMETELSDLDGLKKLTATAVDGYANIVLEFEFGWDKTKIIADVRDRMGNAQAKFPQGGGTYSVSEFNFSEFPIIIISLSGSVPERTLLKVAQGLQDSIESLEPVLSASLTGNRDEMLEVLINPLKLETYNVTAGELIGVVVNNNQLIPAGTVDTENSNFSVKIPSSFDEALDVNSLPVKINGDRVVTLGDIADIRLTFADRTGTARFNGETTVAIQVVKRKGFNLIDTANLVRAEIEKQTMLWPVELQHAIEVTTSNDQSRNVDSMVKQLEGSVLTAIALVMIVVLAALGSRPAFLVGFAIPTSFLLCFAFLAVMGISISNIVMFGLILAVGMLVDGAIVVVEYADKRITEGAGPMEAYGDAAKRMFWPIVSSTATTLCAFLPMLFWPGVPGQFMGMLPVTLIFVLSASLVVALIYLPVLGGVSGGISQVFGDASQTLRQLPWLVRALLVPPALYGLFVGAMQLLNPHYLLSDGGPGGLWGVLMGIALFLISAVISSIVMGSVEVRWHKRRITSGHQRTSFGYFIKFITGNPVMPVVTLAGVVGFVVITFQTFSANNNGVEFFVATEPEQAIVYVQARGNLSVREKDTLLKQAELIILNTPGVQSTFAFAGEGGLLANTGGAGAPLDTIGQAQIELIPWGDRPTIQNTRKILGFIPWTSSTMDMAYDGNLVLNNLQNRLDVIPGIKTQILNLAMGPASAKPVHLRLKGNDWDDLLTATSLARQKFENTEGLSAIEDTLPLPGIDWRIDVDIEKAGRYGANVATVGSMVQLVTRGILLDTMRVESSDEEIEIRVRFPEQDRVLSTLDTLKVRTPNGLIPLSNFISRKPVAKLGQITRVDRKRFFDVKAGVHSDATKIVIGEDGISREIKMTPSERIEEISAWLDASSLPQGIEWEWTGDQEDEAESGAFLTNAFMGALGLMFIILLAQFNSIYNSILVLLAVILSTTGVLIGMLVMDQAFSIIMTGTGIVALAGIVVNNNIVLIDTYQEYSTYMPRLEAITRTAEARIRPVLLTTITTMAGLTPMMFGLSLDFIGGGYTVDSPTALWWKQLATAVVFGLGTATMLTLVFTPAMLALRIWTVSGAYGAAIAIRASSWTGEGRRIREDYRLSKAAKKYKGHEISWEDDTLDTEPSK